MSGYFRASDPGRFAPTDQVSDIQLIARKESKVNQNSKSGKRKRKATKQGTQDGSDKDKMVHLQDHLESEEEGHDGSGEDS